MLAHVTPNGLVVPKRLLKGVSRVEIRKVKGRIVIQPLRGKDPILGLGARPVRGGVKDASANHDKYIYKA